MDGRFAIDRVDDLVVVSQQGWFSVALHEALIEASEVAVRAAVSGNGSCRFLADLRGHEGHTLVGQLKLETWVARRISLIAKFAMITPNSSIRAVINKASHFIPGMSFRLTLTPEEALEWLERQQHADRVAEMLANPVWHTE